MEKIGIIGGGQLAYFLADAAVQLGVEVVVLANRDDVVSQCTRARIIHGSPRDRDLLVHFFNEVKTVIFENEWLDIELLHQQAGNRINFYPHLSLMQRLQNKLYQKQDLVKLNIPTSPYMVLSSKDNLENDLFNVKKQFGANFVLKWSLNGYDGKGVFLAQEQRYVHDEVLAFCSLAFDAGSLVYAEPLVNFKQEVSLVAVRKKNGDFNYYPLVISEQKQGTCQYVFGPAKSFGVSVEIEKMAAGYAQKLADSLDLVGVFAIEFFLTSDDTILVNEIAPRVHNSGHFTLDAAKASQFENHIRAVLNMDLAETQTTNYFAMLNLLGPEGVSINDLNGFTICSADNIALHWYGKKSLRSKRKMGHATISASNQGDYKVLLNRLQDMDEKWKMEMKGIYEA